MCLCNIHNLTSSVRGNKDNDLFCGRYGSRSRSVCSLFFDGMFVSFVLVSKDEMIFFSYRGFDFSIMKIVFPASSSDLSLRAF